MREHGHFFFNLRVYVGNTIKSKKNLKEIEKTTKMKSVKNETRRGAPRLNFFFFFCLYFCCFFDFFPELFLLVLPTKTLK